MEAGAENGDGLDRLEAVLGYRFRCRELLRIALTHPSAVRPGEGDSLHNQRLEFLGDAVLQLVITHELYERFGDAGEGLLTAARARLVNGRCLAARAGGLGLGQYLRMGRCEETSGGRKRRSTLGNAFEAVAGAVYLDSGFAAAQRWIRRLFQEELRKIELVPSLDNPKGELQEILQSRSSCPPQYQMESVSGPDHDRLFECAAYHDGRELGRGIGKSKKEAESRAALEALAVLRLAGKGSVPPFE